MDLDKANNIVSQIRVAVSREMESPVVSTLSMRNVYHTALILTIDPPIIVA